MPGSFALMGLLMIAAGVRMLVDNPAVGRRAYRHVPSIRPARNGRYPTITLVGVCFVLWGVLACGAWLADRI